ncbi:MAG: riboflavin synthase [Proteobacteria bacterium]|nr:riboflavin synthase [Pseudomonadota bacterium]
MFTGIIKATGHVESAVIENGDMRLRVALGELANKGLGAGESIAVNGVCLTAIEPAETHLHADVSRETLAHTTLGSLKAGMSVNLEPAVAAGERLGGHIVNGHVDGVGTLFERKQDGQSLRFGFEVPGDLAKYIARKGSICIDGISLTVNGVDGNRFDVNIVPHTLDQTNLGERKVGDRMNLEVDVIARYLERMLEMRS